jgi:hypothetical protein
MASIGGVTCFSVCGHPPVPKQRVLLWRIPGINGIGAQRVGRNDSAFEVVAIQYSSAADLQLWKASLEAMQGTIVSIVNDIGATSTGCLIVKMSPMRSTAAHAAGGITQRGEIVVEGVVT